MSGDETCRPWADFSVESTRSWLENPGMTRYRDLWQKHATIWTKSPLTRWYDAGPLPSANGPSINYLPPSSNFGTMSMLRMNGGRGWTSSDVGLNVMERLANQILLTLIKHRMVTTDAKMQSLYETESVNCISNAAAVASPIATRRSQHSNAMAAKISTTNTIGWHVICPARSVRKPIQAI